MNNLTQQAIDLQAQRDLAQRRTDQLNAELAETLAKIHKMSQRPQCPDDGIYAFSIRFEEDGKEYQYAAVVTGGNVAITGRMSRVLTWEDFLNWIERQTKDAYFVSSLGTMIYDSSAEIDMLPGFKGPFGS